jgi:hypothetical protein
MLRIRRLPSEVRLVDRVAEAWALLHKRRAYKYPSLGKVPVAIVSHGSHGGQKREACIYKR